MVSVGFKALPLRKHKSQYLSHDRLMADDSKYSYSDIGNKRKMGRKGDKKNNGFHGNVSNERSGGALGKPRKFGQDNSESVSQASFVRYVLD